MIILREEIRYGPIYTKTMDLSVSACVKQTYNQSDSLDSSCIYMDDLTNRTVSV
jgi:hypothetical protein